MIDFYIVKRKDQEPFYNCVDDMGFSTLNKAREQVDYWIKNNPGTSINDYYMVRIEATDKDEIINCFWGGNRGRITKYKILETISLMDNRHAYSN